MLPLLIVALSAFVVFVPFFATTRNLEDLGLESAVLLILAGGGSIVLITGNFDLSSEGTLAFTAVLAGWLMVNASPGGGFGLSPFLVLPLTIMVGGLIGLANAFLVEGLGVNPFIVTLTTLLTLKGAAALPTHALTIYGLPSTYDWIGRSTIAGVSMIVIVALVIYVALALFVRHSLFGRHLYAVGGNREAALRNGISPLRVVSVAYGLSGALAAVAGWLAATRLDSAAPALEDGIIFNVFAAMVIGGVSLTGGKGSLWGAAGGVVLLGAINNVLNLVALNPLYVNFVRGLVLLLAVLLIIVRQRLGARLGLQERAA